MQVSSGRTGAGALSAVDLGMVQALLEEVTVNSTIEPPELTEDWGNRLLEDTDKNLCAPGPRRKEESCLCTGASLKFHLGTPG